MLIEGVESIYPSAGSSYESNTEKLEYTDFLTLFIAQLQNQDPMNPLDSAEFTAQLAQFSNVEQLYQVNANLSGIQETLNSQEQQDYIDIIGKTVKIEGNRIQIEGGKVQSGLYQLEGRADVSVDIFNGDGMKIRTLQVGPQNEGEHEVEWDGRNDSGASVEDGSYFFEVVAKDQEGNWVTSNLYISGEVTGLKYEYGLPYLMLGDKLVSVENTIVEVSQSNAGGS
jgi:flagellar basal-body rod modification protein FlgD